MKLSAASTVVTSYLTCIYVARTRVFQIGVNFPSVEVEKNLFAPVIEAMILKVSKKKKHLKLNIGTL